MLTVKVYGTSKEHDTHTLEPGQLIATKDSLKVACDGGFIEILELQLPGKRKMDVKSLLNGYTFSKNAKLL
jgi:methionyl-tRNA formyltransferase